MFGRKKSYCYVLSGGGAKGVYHIGVWKALQEIDIKVDAFIGNSIGAIMAGFLAQGKSRELEEIGRKISMDFILNVPDELLKNGELKLDMKQLSSFKTFFSSTYEKKGLDTTPLKNLLYENLDESEIRKNGCDLGVVTFSVSDFKAREVFIEDMEHGTVLDYLLASSAFPGFTQPEIAGKKYIDGGVHDNMPYAMARKRGYKRIIVADISGMGMKRQMDFTGSETIYIKNSINMGGVLNFNRSFLDNFMKLGYLDTLKTFSKLDGRNYFLEPDTKMEKKFSCYLKKNFSDFDFKKLFPDSVKYEKKYLMVMMDCAASILGMERIEKRSYRTMFDEIRCLKIEVEQSVETLANRADEEEQKGLGKKLDFLFKEALKPESFKEPDYFYHLALERKILRIPKKFARKTLNSLIPELETGIFFLEILESLHL